VDHWSELGEELAAAARVMQGEVDTQHVLDRAVALAVEMVDGCDQAGVSTVHRKAPIDTAAASDPLVRRGDELQYSLQEGPCLDSIWHHETVHSRDLAADGRWPRWGPAVVAELGVASMLCFQLYTNADTLGALNLYSEQVDAFDEDDLTAGLVLAAHTAVALAGAQHVEQLRTAALNRTIIGQAQGILMERFRLSADRAFLVLRRVSQDRNVKLHQVASELVQTRVLPPPARPERVAELPRSRRG
jgi:GAF domain-containing protein